MDQFLKLVGINYKKEHYGPVHLGVGDYPIAHNLDNGGCADGACARPISAAEKAKAQCAQKMVNERSGNNPYEFHLNKPALNYGTGCMNPSCQCPTCQGDCVCARRVEHFGFNDFFADKDWTFWIITFVVAYLMYYFLKTRAKK